MITKYNKLVRDKIPEYLQKKGIVAATHAAEDDEYWTKLKEKLKEEVEEFLKESSEEELADVLEVVYAIRDHKGFSELESTRQAKVAERGGFKDKVILEETKE